MNGRIAFELVVGPRQLGLGSRCRQRLIVRSGKRGADIVVPVDVRALPLSLKRPAVPLEKLMGLFNLKVNISVVLSIFVILSAWVKKCRHRSLRSRAF